MNFERSKNTKRNMISGLGNKFVTVFLPFFVKSLMIQKLGVGYLGLDSLFSSILQVLNLAELGFGEALVFSMYKPVAENDKDTICALLRAYKIIYKIVGIIILIIGMAILPFIPKFIKGSYPNGINIYILYLIYLINTVISYWMFAYKVSILNAFQRADVINNVRTLVKITLSAAQIMVLYFTGNYYCYIILLPLFTIINNVMNAYMANKMFGDYVCEGTLGREMATDIRWNVIGLTVSRLCQTTRSSFDNIFISSFLGIVISGMYSNYYYVMTAALMIGYVLTGAMRASVGNSIVCYDEEKNYKDMTKFNFLYMWIGGWCTVCLVCMIQPFMGLWAGKEFMFDFKVVVLMGVYFYILRMGDIRDVYSSAKGLWWQNRYRDITESIANLLLNYLFVRMWGICGIILATLVSVFLINFCYGSHIVFRYYFKSANIREYFQLHVFYGVVTLIACFMTYQICKLVHINGIIELLIKLGICCIVPNCIYIAIYCNTWMYKQSVPWILKVMK